MSRNVMDARAWAHAKLRDYHVQDSLLARNNRPGDRFDQNDLEPKERALALELWSGTIRRRWTLDILLSSLSSRPLSRLDPDVLTALRLGAYQLLFLDGAPDFAVINTSVENIPRRSGGVLRGFANAVLRRLAAGRQILSDLQPFDPLRTIPRDDGRFIVLNAPLVPDETKDPAGRLGFLYSFPPAALRLLRGSVPQNRLTEFLMAANRRPGLHIRAHLGRTSTEHFVQDARQNGVSVREIDGFPPGRFIAHGLKDPSTWEPFRRGLCTIQGPHAASVAPFLAPLPGERILDLCAAPGGKTAHLAELSQGAAEIVAVARDAAGQTAIRENLTRLGSHGVRVVLAPEPAEILSQGPFDAVLLDVPCSNSGVLNRRPEARYRLGPDHLRELTTLQESLLSRTRDVLLQQDRPSRIVYSTCSVLVEENESLVERVSRGNLRVRPDVILESWPDQEGGDGGYCRRILIRGCS